MKVISHANLESVFHANKGVAWVGIYAETVQNILNKGRGELSMWNTLGIDPDRIIKHCEGVFAVSSGGVSYEDFVNNRLVKEAKEHEGKVFRFNAEKHAWGKLMYEDCNALMCRRRDNGGRYLVVYGVANNPPKVWYTYEGESIDLTDSKFDSYRKPPKVEGARQGTEEPIIIRDYAFDSLRRIKMFKEEYMVEP